MSRSGLAPIGGSGKKKKPVKQSDDFGDMLEDILDKPSKKSNQSLNLEESLGQSFDSYGSASDSFPSPPGALGGGKGRSSPTALLSAGKGATSSPTARSSGTFFTESVDLESSTGGLDESTNSSPGGAYMPSIRSAKAKKTTTSTIDDRDDDMPESGMSGKSNNSNSNNDDDEESVGVGGYNPFAGGKPRQRRQLGGGAAAASLDELDSMLGFKPATSAPAPIPAQPPQLAESSKRTSLRDYDSSGDEYDHSEDFGGGRSNTNNNNNSNSISNSNSSKSNNNSDKIRKNLSVRIDTDTSSTAEATTESIGTTSYSSYNNNNNINNNNNNNNKSNNYPDMSYEPTVSGSTPSRAIGNSKTASHGSTNSPAWLGSNNNSNSNEHHNSKSPKTSDRRPSSDNIATNAGSGSDQTFAIRYLQQDAEAAQLEREAVERQLRLEISELKSKLVVSSAAAAAATINDNNSLIIGSGTSTSTGNNHNRSLKENNDLRKQIAQQEIELSRLRDEASLTQLKYNEEAKYTAQRHANDINNINLRKDEEISLIEKRHNDAVKALKSLHLDEITSIKERSKDNAALDQLTQQLKSASGSIRLLEEQLLSKHRGLDAAKEGQMEARERLLNEMEEKARMRADGAEAETYRLKGLLMHMEHVAGNLRSQGGEEKERLRQEHQRLFTLQSSLETERNSFQIRVNEELNIMKDKMEYINKETIKLNNDKKLQNENLLSLQRSIDIDRAEFASYVMTHTKTAEATSERFREEDIRLTRIREELNQERIILEQRKSSAMNDIKESETIKNNIIISQEDINKEKIKLQSAVSELNIAANALSQQGETLDKQARLLDIKEKSIREGQAQLKISQVSLNRRENELMKGIKEMEKRLNDMNIQDHDITKKRMEQAVRERELSSKESINSMSKNNIIFVNSNSINSNSNSSSYSEGENMSPNTNTKQQPPKKSPKVRSPATSTSTNADNDTANANANAISTSMSDWTRSFRQRLNEGQRSTRETDNEKIKINDELMRTKKTLQLARGTLAKTTSTRLQTEKLLNDNNENKFLMTLQAQRTRSKLNSSEI
jgi:hypothetical protein